MAHSTRPAADPPRGACHRPTDLRLLDNPLDFIAEDHLRERCMCQRLDTIADTRGRDRTEVSALLRYLGRELPDNLADKDENLFPLMRRRCAPEDQIDTVLDRMERAHADLRAAAPAVIGLLQGALGAGIAVPGSAAEALHGFARIAREQLIVENAIVLPIARARLNATDLNGLRGDMLRRRRPQHKDTPKP